METKIKASELSWAQRIKIIALFLATLTVLVPVLAIITHGIVELWQLAWGIW